MDLILFFTFPIRVYFGDLEREWCVCVFRWVISNEDAFSDAALNCPTLNVFFSEMQYQPLIKGIIQVSNLEAFWARDHHSKSCFI